VSFACPAGLHDTVRGTQEMEEPKSRSQSINEREQFQDRPSDQSKGEQGGGTGSPEPSGKHPQFNRIICGSSEDMREIADQTVHLVVTSPPYHVGKEYETEQSFQGWLVMMKRVCAEMRRVLVPGGRAGINVAGIGRNPYRPTQYYVTGIMLNLGFLMRGEIIWNKGASAGGSSAWGSWMSATNPVLRDTHEYVLIFSKESMKRETSSTDSIGRDEFLMATRSVWEIPAASARRIGHPSPFPLELPKRLIQLYSFEGDVVLDPFCGSGTTCGAGTLLGRRYGGIDKSSEYCDLARRRISSRTSLTSPSDFDIPACNQA